MFEEADRLATPPSRISFRVPSSNDEPGDFNMGAALCRRPALGYASSYIDIVSYPIASSFSLLFTDTSLLADLYAEYSRG